MNQECWIKLVPFLNLFFLSGFTMLEGWDVHNIHTKWYAVWSVMAPCFFYCFMDYDGGECFVFENCRVVKNKLCQKFSTNYRSKLLLFAFCVSATMESKIWLCCSWVVCHPWKHCFCKVWLCFCRVLLFLQGTALFLHGIAVFGSCSQLLQFL